jgi:hypothetical protein
MESLVILMIAGVAMSLFSIVVMAFYSILEADHKKKEIRRFARKQVMKQLEREKLMVDKLQEPVDIYSEAYK